MKLIAKAIISVMKEVKGMEKNSRVGSGNYGYNGTKDQDVKEVFNTAMANHGLCIIPINIQDETQIDRWSENGKQKQSVFTKVTVKYMLLHDSGESIEIAGYGHGIDSQDKGAGKATTYAMKNALLYTFLTPVGKIDDTDTTHSNDIKTPVKTATTTEPIPTPKRLTPEQVKLIPKSNELESLETVLKTYTLQPTEKTAINKRIKELKK